MKGGEVALLSRHKSVKNLDGCNTQEQRAGYRSSACLMQREAGPHMQLAHIRESSRLDTTIRAELGYTLREAVKIISKNELIIFRLDSTP